MSTFLTYCVLLPAKLSRLGLWGLLAQSLVWVFAGGDRTAMRCLSCCLRWWTIGFFHLDALCSGIAIQVDLDLMLALTAY